MKQFITVINDSSLEFTLKNGTKYRGYISGNHIGTYAGCNRLIFYWLGVIDAIYENPYKERKAMLSWLKKYCPGYIVTDCETCDFPECSEHNKDIILNLIDTMNKFYKDKIYGINILAL